MINRIFVLNPGMALAVMLIIFCVAGILLVTRTIFSVIAENMLIKKKLLRPWYNFLRHRHFRPFFDREFPESDIYSIIRAKESNRSVKITLKINHRARGRI